MAKVPELGSGFYHCVRKLFFHKVPARHEKKVPKSKEVGINVDSMIPQILADISSIEKQSCAVWITQMLVKKC